ncbi:MAG: acyclic terpene utilization AtuA family protein [Betaproteobacteria bacterium]|nr:acyclic terpene utilization AtuA family protein [Betaproteobacteria bacterium]
MKILAASGQLGYGIPEEAFRRGVARQPDVIGADMGSIDPGPYCLGSGEMVVAGEGLRRDLRMVLEGAKETGAPLLMGSAGTAGRRSQLDGVVEVVESVAKERGIKLRLATIPADIPKEVVRKHLRAGDIEPCGTVPALTEEELDRATGIVAQMGVEPFQRAIEMGAEVVIAGRACDTSMFAAIPLMKGYDKGLTMHMAKLIECASACADPGGRDASMGVMGDGYFVVESMHPRQRCTPVSVAAHALYEQSDPFQLEEPGGIIDLAESRYEQIDERRVRVTGSVWRPSSRYCVKLEGARHTGFRYLAMGGIRDPRMIAATDSVAEETRQIVSRTFVGSIDPSDYTLTFRIYGKDAVLGPVEPTPSMAQAHEIFVLIDVVGRTELIAKSVCGVAKQFFLHLRYPGILCTSGNIAHPFSPDVLAAGAVYEFNIYHLMPAGDPCALFPIQMRTIGG